MAVRELLSSHRSLLANVAVSVLAAGFALGGAELALRALFPVSDQYRVLPEDSRVLLEPGPQVHGVSGTASYETNALGIRGRPVRPNLDEFRVLAIGGSTTQNLYLDQSETWPILLSDLLGPTADGRATWSGDVGQSGQTTKGHVLQLERFAPQVPGLDVVVVLVGFNDLMAALNQGYSYVPGSTRAPAEPKREDLLRAFWRVPGGLRVRVTMYQDANVSAVKRLALYQLGLLVRERLLPRDSGRAQDPSGEMYGTWRQHRADSPQGLEDLPDLEAPLQDYRANLTRMVASAAAQGVRLIFVTPPAVWRADLTPEEEARLWFGGTGAYQEEAGHDYFASATLREALDRYNDTLRSVCEQSSVECIDLERGFPRDTAMFYDDVHFTERGSRLAAEQIAAYFRARPPYGNEPIDP